MSATTRRSSPTKSWPGRRPRLGVPAAGRRPVGRRRASRHRAVRPCCSLIVPTSQSRVDDDVEQVDHEVDEQHGHDEDHDDVLDECRSRLATASSSRLPRPGMTKTRSTTTAPISKVASCSASTVTTGMAALRSPCRRSAAREGRAPSRAPYGCSPRAARRGPRCARSGSARRPAPDRARAPAGSAGAANMHGILAGWGPAVGRQPAELHREDGDQQDAGEERRDGHAQLRERREHEPGRPAVPQRPSTVPRGSAMTSAMTIEHTTSQSVTWSRSAICGPIARLRHVGRARGRT